MGPASSPGIANTMNHDETLHLELDGSPDAAPAARHALRRLVGRVDPGTLEKTGLLITELVSNSVKYGAAPRVDVRVVLEDESVKAQVSDEGPGFAPARRQPSQESSGWGLFLVDRLADRWGVVRDGEETQVWFELRAA